MKNHWLPHIEVLGFQNDPLTFSIQVRFLWNGIRRTMHLPNNIIDDLAGLSNEEMDTLLREYIRDYASLHRWSKP